MLELCWRWSAGALLLLLAGWQAWRIAAAAAPAVVATGLTRLTLEAAVNDPDTAAQAFTQATAVVQPAVEHAVLGLAPLGLFLWSAAFALGRTAVLRAYDASLPPRRFLLGACEGVRLLLLAAVSLLWYQGLLGCSHVALAAGEPNLPLYAALVIGLSLGAFAVWSALGWALLAAPVVGLLQRVSFAQALGQALRLRRTRRRLLDVNLTMAVIKVALLLLAVVFSASPLPFADYISGWPVYAWYGVVTLLYLAASDFFKLARALAFVEFCRAAGSEPVH
jgi:hypothetical protein